MRVSLIPTGKLELLGLAEALQRLFPSAIFNCIPFTADVTPIAFRSFTSARLPLPSLEDPGSSLSELVGALADTMNHADMAIVLEDLELFNQENELTVLSAFREAVERHLARLRRRDAQGARALSVQLRERASFHLAVPMIESWLFADPNGPLNASAPPIHLPARLAADCDPEHFLTDDPDYAADVAADCTKWRSLPAYNQARARPEWLKTTFQRETHPKRYLSWLCRAADQRNCSTYDDKAGAVALQKLDWECVLSNPNQMKWLRSLVGDLANYLGTAPSLSPDLLQGTQATLTSIHTARKHPLLRNL